ncbi:hypothetical protein [Pseudomonas faucium]|uniref:hypothetical protein n=1 Tax=Pseudomonas faucium TaxID=2740518 RepID=UPI0039C00813
MRITLAAFIVSASVLAGCAPVQTGTGGYAAAPAKKEPHVFKPRPYTYDKESPEATNFASQLDMPAFQCDLEAMLGRDAVRYGLRDLQTEYSNSFMKCVKFAHAQGNEAVTRLKSAKVPAKQLELSKDLYAKWSAYLSSMSPYRMPDHRAKSDYQAAKQALATEVKFSK